MTSMAAEREGGGGKGWLRAMTADLIDLIKRTGLVQQAWEANGVEGDRGETDDGEQEGQFEEHALLATPCPYVPHTHPRATARPATLHDSW